VLREEEGTGIELHQDLALGDGPELKNENRIVIPESGEESAFQEEGWHAIGPAFSDVWQAE
jgi:hypothetical protein